MATAGRRGRHHDIRQGHVPARSGEELAQTVVEAFGGLSVPCALTGLAATWVLPFAGDRLVTVSLRRPAGNKLLERLGSHEVKPGASPSLIRSNDEGVFHGGQTIGGAECVSPLQVYLDPRGLPERA